ncbi:MAG: peptidylprolyl isomerase [Candidatus Omnitrophica bacterium]|nr:peptidylprolyl isomerase [Candidatus Omnitrophota bacterium]
MTVPRFLLWPAFLFLIFCARTSAAAEVLERILAVVNDEIVTEQDLQILVAPVASQYRTLYTADELEGKLKETREEFLRKVIEDKLVLSEAKRKQVIVSDAEVDEMMTDVRNKFPSREVFLEAIEEQGLTEKKLWNRFRDQLMSQKLVAYEVKSKVSVSPGEINQYYKTHTEEFSQGERVRLRQILIREGSRPEEDAKAFADSLVARLDEGKPFEDLAKTYSEGSEAKEGGQMGWVEKGQLLGEIDRVVFSLKEGEHTLPIKSSLGYHLFQVVEKQSASLKPVSDVRLDIQEKLFKQKMKWRLESWIESLKKSAYLSIR